MIPPAPTELGLPASLEEGTTLERAIARVLRDAGLRRAERWWADALGFAALRARSLDVAASSLQRDVYREIARLERERRSRALCGIVRLLVRRSMSGLAPAILDLVAPLRGDAEEVLRALFEAESGRVVSRVLRERFTSRNRPELTPYPSAEVGADASSDSLESVVREMVRVVGALTPGFESALASLECAVVFDPGRSVEEVARADGLVVHGRAPEASEDQLARVKLARSVLVDAPGIALAALERSALSSRGSASAEALRAALHYAAGRPYVAEAVPDRVTVIERNRIARFLAARCADPSSASTHSGSSNGASRGEPIR